MAYYLDTPAFLKLVTTEPETPALRSWVQREDPMLFSSDLLRTEALRAARRYSVEAHRLARRRLEALTLLSLTADISERAGDLDPAILRSLDALHLASALSLADELEGIVTYDERLGVAAGLHGVSVVAPSGE
jgi:predicted nucleic acid-binding protein